MTGGTPQRGIVDIWRIDQTRLGSVDTAVLSDDERSRAAKLARPMDRDMFRARHAALRTILAGYVDCSPRDLQFSTGASGKPALRHATVIRFNLSDSGCVAVLAVTDTDELGVDIEEIRPVDGLERLAGRYFAESEATALSSLKDEVGMAAFFRCWTRKEAILKADGRGMALGLRHAEVGIEAWDEAGRVVGVGGTHYALRDLAIQSGFCAAVASTGPIQRIQYRGDI